MVAHTTSRLVGECLFNCDQSLIWLCTYLWILEIFSCLWPPILCTHFFILPFHKLHFKDIAWVSLPCLRSILGCNLKGNITKCPLPIDFVEKGGSEKILFVCCFIVPFGHFHKETRAFSILQKHVPGCPHSPNTLFC